MQADMRFSRTSAAITPKVFTEVTEVLHSHEAQQFKRVSTVRVEETGPEIMAASSSTPTSAPRSFAPHRPPARNLAGPSPAWQQDQAVE